MKYDEQITRLAARNLAEKESVLCEPRLYYDNFVFDGSTERVFGAPDVFRNGEKWPLRITHLVSAMLFESDDQQDPVGGDERMVQRYGLRIRAHGTYYQNAEVTPIPLMANVPLAASDIITQALASWDFPKPVILGNRDTFQVEVQLLVAPASGTERVAVTFSGLGFYSRQPKKLTGFVNMSEAGLTTTLDIDDFRNDGTEPLEVHSVTIHHTPSTAQSNPVGNIRNVRCRIRLNGNGTNQWWSLGPVGGNQLPPAHLWGLSCGRAVVHRLPGEGWLLYPNEGFNPEIWSFLTTREETVLLAIAGYVMVI